MPFVKDQPQTLPDAIVQAVSVKFWEGTHVRLRGGTLSSQPEGEREEAELAAAKLDRASIAADLAALQNAVLAHPAARGIEREFQQTSEVLAAWRAAGEANSGKALADLELFFRIPLVEGTRAAEIADFVASLNEFASVEVATLQVSAPLPVDIPPMTTDFDVEGRQGYLDSAAIGGIDARYAWTVQGGRGTGVKIVDVEYTWRYTHEDYPPIQHRNFNSIGGGTGHGDAVIGILAAPDNSYGVTGIASDALISLESVLPHNGAPTDEDNSQVASAIVSAALLAGPGGVVLIEQQAGGGPIPDGTVCCAGACLGYMPVEKWPSAFAAIENAVASGVNIVEAAGNGSTNLDDEVFNGIYSRAVRDSGAILVAAGESGANSGAPLCTSNYGSRIDLHSWGRNVVSLGGEGGLIFDGSIKGISGSDPNQYYTGGFGGTSSASAIVAGAVASTLGVASVQGVSPFSPSAVRDLLVNFGAPPLVGPRYIGPQPDLRAALVSLGGTPSVAAAFTFQCTERSCAFDGQGSTGANSWSWSFGDGTFASGATVSHTYAASGIFDVGLTIQGNGAQIDTVEHSVQVGLVPVASFTISCSARVCEADGRASTSDFGSLQYQFNFGGGGNSDAVSPGVRRFTYDAPGSYTVRLIVTDSAQQTSTATRSIVVRSDGVRTQVVGIQKDLVKFRLGTANSSATYVMSSLPPASGVALNWPVAGDWNGDGIDSIGKFDPGSATFYLRNSHTPGASPDWTFAFGDSGAGQLPVAGDWNGDGQDTVGVFDGATGTFRLRNSNAAGAADVTFILTGSQTSWLPISGDWDGDGVDSVGLYDPATSTFHLRNANTTGAADLSFVFGNPDPNLLPMAGDWNGDGWDSIGLYNPSNRRSLLRNMDSAGPADFDFQAQWESGGKPLAGDWDGI